MLHIFARLLTVIDVRHFKIDLIIFFSFHSKIVHRFLFIVPQSRFMRVKFQKLVSQFCLMHNGFTKIFTYETGVCCPQIFGFEGKIA